MTGNYRNPVINRPGNPKTRRLTAHRLIWPGRGCAVHHQGLCGGKIFCSKPYRSFGIQLKRWKVEISVEKWKEDLNFMNEAESTLFNIVYMFLWRSFQTNIAGLEYPHFHRKYIDSIRVHFPASYVRWSRSVVSCGFTLDLSELGSLLKLWKLLTSLDCCLAVNHMATSRKQNGWFPSDLPSFPGWWFQPFLNFHPENWGNDPIWPIFFKWIEKNN